eukprot:Hpha_TRINITY_DN2151_c0_g1::TRINITY_DN2151_c0_g1_i2::g.42259::m.42259
MRAGAVLLLCTLGAEGAMQTFQLTWYGAKDNCPPGGDIAYPGSAPRHAHAGGTGTYADPITFAGARKREAPGTIYYIPTFQKYFVMEDDCEECGEDWSKGKYHIDLWMGSTTVHPGKGLIECEDSMTARHPVNTAPPANLTVNTTAIFDATRSANQGCLYPVESCTDVGNECGNECEAWTGGLTCDDLAKRFALSLSRFKALNPKLDCSGTVPEGKTVCMGGTCGD